MAAKTIQARALACPNCGAKLRWDRDAPVIECRYCQTHVLVDTGRPTDQATDVISTAAPSSRATLAIGMALVVVGGGISIAVVKGNAGRAAHTTTAPAKTSTTAELAATPIAATPEAIAARHGARVAGTTVQVFLSDGPFKEAAFYWDKAHLDHVSSVTLWHRSAQPDVAALLDRARAQLGSRLRAAATGGHQFGAKAVGFHISPTVHIISNPSADPAWKEQLAAMWTVMKGAALGTRDTLDERTRRDVLNLAYPLTVLTQIPFAVTVDDAAREVARVAPGVDTKGERHTIGLAHPWFESASLGWTNEPGGTWSGITLYYPKELDFGARHEELVACMAPVLGAPKKLVSDHLAGTFTLQYAARGGTPWVNVGPQAIGISPHYRFGDPATEAGLHALLEALAACGS